MSTAEELSGTGAGGKITAVSDTRSQVGQAVVGRAVVGLGVGVLAGAFARSRSQSYGAQESSALRVTAHATVPFFVAASMLTDRLGARVAVPFRGGFLGAHLVHMGEIARLVRNHGAGEPLIRAELAGGAPLYGLLALQAALLTRVRSVKARRMSRRIDTHLLRIYCLAVGSGLASRRRSR